ncbi:hypothetical protein SAMN05444581_1342 [Methylocapsa palsarum]|uniref:Uncharacterized protein n=1 Tax=Methylocapsa palsarum TaxID=1612308 RepID=A0A1I4CZQ1_9HYPH|nr:hypothetical protein SAMN05444581_1342 [Methylocapsa palsarum]
MARSAEAGGFQSVRSWDCYSVNCHSAYGVAVPEEVSLLSVTVSKKRILARGLLHGDGN